MCGFVQRQGGAERVLQTLEHLGLSRHIETFKAETGKLLNFYPAFGQDARRQLTNLIISNEQCVNATWWFDCVEGGNSLKVGERTTFNARNLDSPFWKKAIEQRRGLVVATAIGESNKVGNTNAHYLMETNEVFLLGAVYRAFPNGCYSAAVITRPPHPRFSQYHERAIPCFLPNDKTFIQDWLADAAPTSAIWAELDNPRIHQGMTVTPVKTFKSGEAVGRSEQLIADK